jgi:hypothetical protein
MVASIRLAAGKVIDAIERRIEAPSSKFGFGRRPN